jgi:hypothetical protein
MTETQTISEEEVIRAQVAVSQPKGYIEAYHKAHTRLLGKAVLANAEGWQSGIVHTEVYERPYDMTVVVRVLMKMSRETEKEAADQAVA